MSTLIIIDMQPAFSGIRYEKTFNKIYEEIRLAKKRKAEIIFVEYVPHKVFGKTYRKLILAAKRRTRKTHYVYKETDGGGQQIFDYLKRKKIPLKNIKICGVNTNMCVYYTVNGLSKHGSAHIKKIEVVKDACMAATKAEHEFGLKSLSGIKNVKIV